MKHLLLAVFLAGSAANAFAQPCIPDPLYADSLYGIWPDTVDNFATGTVGVAYFQSLNLIVPQDAGLINPTFNGVTLDSVALNGVTGLPPGLTYACASQSPAPCTFMTAQLGCAVIEGTPTTAGLYPLSIDVTAYTNLFGNVIPIPQSFGGYRITIEDNGTGILEAGLVALGGVRNVPNPFSTRTAIEFQMDRAGEVKVRVFNLLGDELWSNVIAGKAGANKVLFDGNDLQDGIYLYKVESGKNSYTGRMVLHR
ncbi:MAG: T9SS type A sorting domain-containing protein [Flavobacteriales bacterium]|nr:T9SS type A sorting domain-containing protein [Flavobacteriales bacterium]